MQAVAAQIPCVAQTPRNVKPKRTALRRKKCTRKLLMGTCPDLKHATTHFMYQRTCVVWQKAITFSLQRKVHIHRAMGALYDLMFRLGPWRLSLLPRSSSKINNKFTHLLFSWASTCQTLLARLSTFGGYQAIWENLVCIKRISRILLTKPK